MAHTVSFSIKKSLYPKSVLFRACYTLIGKYYVYLDEASPEEWAVTLTAKPEGAVPDAAVLEGEFKNELVAESLRETIAENSKKIKEIIVARALYGASNDAAAGPQANADFSYVDEAADDYLDDPLGIAVPWEEKHPDGEG